MPSLPLVKAQIGQTALRAQRSGENELIIEDLLSLDPGDVITVEGEEMVVVHAEVNPKAPGPRGPVPQTRLTLRRAPTPSQA